MYNGPEQLFLLTFSFAEKQVEAHAHTCVKVHQIRPWLLSGCSSWLFVAEQNQHKLPMVKIKEVSNPFQIIS